MNVSISLEESANPDDLRDLYRELVADMDLRGRVRQIVRSPGQDELSGGALQAIEVILAPGGVAAALAGTVIVWLRARRGKLRVLITRADGTKLELDCSGIRELRLDQVQVAVEELARSMESGNDDR